MEASADASISQHPVVEPNVCWEFLAVVVPNVNSLPAALIKMSWLSSSPINTPPRNSVAAAPDYLVSSWVNLTTAATP